MPRPELVVVMGVTGAGKSTIGERLSERLAVAYIDADTFHSRDAIAKMRAGNPLTEADREPWLDAVGGWLHSHRQVGGVVACSALKRRYRDVLRDLAQVPVCFLHLAGDQETVAARVRRRAGHYAPVALVDSQFQALEELEADELGQTVDLSRSPDDIVSRFVQCSEEL